MNVRPADDPGLADEIALRRLAEDYARCADRVDGDGLAALFVHDGVIRIITPDGVTSRELVGRARIADAITRLDRYVATMHVVANHYADVHGDIANAEVYCHAHHLVPAAGERAAHDHVMMIRYRDRCRREPGGWRFVERVVHVAWTAEHTVTASPPARPGRPT